MNNKVSCASEDREIQEVDILSANDEGPHRSKLKSAFNDNVVVGIGLTVNAAT